ncbi:DUF2169 domain-containing protein [Citreicella sp. C3M06]|uniref:DUF2169 family type VI secretion system accessory protein n=1 Tax=Citreicella sp. C3M06 TaxID=2841564 RepID=UPI001C0941CB|nr:DUF2169 domain-containing protein [Citreicella sp. C3M06]MBU2959874.1 DUF2169 domain-containing protein [Citreicella sp. C3M06]
MQLTNTSPMVAQTGFGFDLAGREIVLVVIKARYDFPEPGGVPQLAELQPEPLYCDVFGANPETDAPVLENDFALMKPLCDVVCDGMAMAPGGRPVTALTVGMRLGRWQKVFEVSGPRIWLRSGLGHRVSDPRAFAELAIGYDHAWGGSDPDPLIPGHAATWQENPCGVGYYPNRAEREGAPLPVTYQPGKPVNDALGPYQPMALGPVGRSWLPRRRHTGTYDQHWLDHRTPLLPEDFDFRYFQCAASDQQIAYPQGGEPLELLGLTPEGRFGMTLPRERLVLSFLRKNGPVSQKLPNLDTIVVHPQRRQLSLTWRSRFSCNRDLHDLAEITLRREPPR